MPDSRPGNKPHNHVVAKVCLIAVDRCRPLLSGLRRDLLPEEREQAERYRRAEDAERFIIARALTRRLCATCLGLEPGAISILRTASGKPYVEPNTGRSIEFNISHSGNLLIVAWSTAGPVGVDVEAVQPGTRASFMELSNSALSPAELEVLRSASSAEIAAIFYRIWVRKEAVLKAEGLGIGGLLRSFSVAEKTARGIRWCEDTVLSQQGRTWKLQELNPAPGYAACIAVPSGVLVQECADLPGLLGCK